MGVLWQVKSKAGPLLYRVIICKVKKIGSADSGSKFVNGSSDCGASLLRDEELEVLHVKCWFRSKSSRVNPNIRTSSDLRL